jgi:hypothetical protein
MDSNYDNNIYWSGCFIDLFCILIGYTHILKSLREFIEYFIAESKMYKKINDVNPKSVDMLLNIWFDFSFSFQNGLLTIKFLVLFFNEF